MQVSTNHKHTVELTARQRKTRQGKADTYGQVDVDTTLTVTRGRSTPRGSAIGRHTHAAPQRPAVWRHHHH